MKKASLGLLLLSMLLISGITGFFNPVIGDTSGYKVLAYRDRFKVAPGENVTIFAQLYQGTNIVTQNVQLNIHSWFDLDLDETAMVPLGSGLFAYNISIPGDYEYNDVDLDIDAYVDEMYVANEWYEIELAIPQLRDNYHAISQRLVNPGDTLEIQSYMPDMADGTITNGSFVMDISCDLGDLATNLTANYIGNGVFKTNWQVPPSLDLSDPAWEDSDLTIMIQEKGLGPETSTYFAYSINLGDFFVDVTTDVDGTTLIVDVSVYDVEYQPISDVDLSLNFTQELGDYPYEILTEIKTAPPTNSTGQSQFLYELNETCNKVSVKTRGSKGDSVVYETTTDYSPFYRSPSLAFVVVVMPSSLEEIQQNYEREVGLGYSEKCVAYFNDEILANKDITVYIVTSLKIIQVATYTTDENGLFTVEVDESAIGKGLDVLSLEFAYYNGTDWFDCAYSYSFSIGDSGEISDFGDPDDISMSVETKGRVTITTFTLKNLGNTPFVVLVAIPFYEPGPKFFWELIRFLLSSDKGGIPQNGEISFKGALSSKIEILYYVVVAYKADTTKPSGYATVAWILDAEGDAIELLSSESDGILGFSMEWAFLTLLFLGMGSINLRRRSRKC
ncbi:MAG: hypothetical protein ACFE7E_08430 [Candidatus Hodarchaeota archaeon]